eukprot:Nk52_evm15s367 gene=Nk52_evmTU15s367
MEIKSKIEKFNSEHKVMIWSKSYCPYCDRVKQFLAGQGLDYFAYELDKEEDGSEIQNALHSMTGQRTVPNVFLGGKHAGGCSEVTGEWETKKQLLN